VVGEPAVDEHEVHRPVGLGRVDVDQLGKPARRGHENAIGRVRVAHRRRGPENELLDRSQLGWGRRRRNHGLYDLRASLECAGGGSDTERQRRER